MGSVWFMNIYQSFLERRLVLVVVRRYKLQGKLYYTGMKLKPRRCNECGAQSLVVWFVNFGGHANLLFYKDDPLKGQQRQESIAED